jgi:hypothetical protein
MLEQFDLAIQNGLQGRLLPLAEHRQRATGSNTTLSPRQSDSRSDLCDNRSIRSITPSPVMVPLLSVMSQPLSHVIPLVSVYALWYDFCRGLYFSLSSMFMDFYVVLHCSVWF